jgi:hypothetical protein
VPLRTRIRSPEIAFAVAFSQRRLTAESPIGKAVCRTVPVLERRSRSTGTTSPETPSTSASHEVWGGCWMR